MSKKVLINVAPVAATCRHIDPQAIAADVLECRRQGAAMVHLHVRDEHGALTSDTKLLEETLKLIREQSDIIIEVSTGGVSDLTIAERCAPIPLPLVEACSLNVGSTNLGDAVYVNRPADVEYCVQELLKYHKIPEVETFEIGHTHTTLQLMEKRGYLLRVPSDEDARMKCLRLTEKAVKQHERVVARIRALEERVAKGFTEEELDTLFGQFERIKQNLSAENG